jgi:phage-related protein
MAATLVKKVMLKITADDGDTESKLSRIAAKAEELGREHPDIKVKIDSAAASAKMGVLRQELKAVGKAEADTGNSSMGLRSRFLGLGQAVNGLTLGLPRGVGEMSMLQKAMVGLNLATGIGEPLLAGATVAVGGLAAAGVSAGAGLGVFGVVAKAVYTKVSTALTGVTTAQKAYAAATTKAGRASALKAEAAATDQLTGSQRQFATALTETKNKWSNFVNAASPGVITVMAGAMRLMPQALSLMKPFLDSIEPALQVVISDVQKGLSSSWFKGFASSMATFSGPALVGISTAIGNVIKGIAGILKAFIPVSGGILTGLDKMTAKFATWGTTLTGHSGFQSLMKMFQTDTPLAVSALGKLGNIAKIVIGQMAGMDTFGNSKMFLQLANGVLSFANGLLKAHPEIVWLALYLKMGADGAKKLTTAISGVNTGVSAIKGATSAVGNLRGGLSDAEVAASDASGAWGTFGGKISSMVGAVREWGIGSKIAAAATKVWTGIQAAFDVVMDANPIGIVVIAIAALVAAIVICTIKFKSFRDFWKDVWKVTKQVASDAWHFLENVFKAIVRSITAQWDLAKRVTSDVWNAIKGRVQADVNAVKSILSWFSRIGGLFRGWWDSGVSAVEGAAGRMVSFVRGIPGKILSALGNLGSLLFSAGQRVIQGLISGIGSMIGSVGSAIGNIASEITSHLPFSPAKKGPLSGRGDPRLAGQRIGSYLAQGITSSAGMVHTAAERVAGAASVTTAAGRAGAGAGERLTAEWIGGSGADAEFITWLKKNIRIRGGNPAVLGR